MTGLLIALDRWLRRLYFACGCLAAACLVVMAALIVTSIVSRLIGVYVPGVNAYSGYALAAASFLALAYTFVEGGHIRVAILRTRLAGATRLVIELWCLAVASFFACYLAWYMIRLTWVSWKLEERSEGIDATLLWIPQSVAAFGAFVVALAVVHSLVRLVITHDTDALEPPRGAAHMDH